MSHSLWPHGLQAHQAPLSMDFPGKNSGVGSHFIFQGIFSTQRSSPHPLNWQADSLPSESPGKPKNTGVGSLSLSNRSSQPRNQTGVSCIAADSLPAKLLGIRMIKLAKIYGFWISPGTFWFCGLVWDSEIYILTPSTSLHGSDMNDQQIFLDK